MLRVDWFLDAFLIILYVASSDSIALTTTPHQLKSNKPIYISDVFIPVAILQ